jgi:hypothetical protein
VDLLGTNDVEIGLSSSLGGCGDAMCEDGAIFSQTKWGLIF